jgi:hypothetical protein
MLNAPHETRAAGKFIGGNAIAPPGNADGSSASENVRS